MYYNNQNNFLLYARRSSVIEYCEVGSYEDHKKHDVKNILIECSTFYFTREA